MDEARSIVSEIAYHYYSGDHFENIKLVREHFPEKLIIHTEGCIGFYDVNAEDEYKNGEIYAHDIIGDLNAGVNAYIDWNLLLDNKRGSNHKKNYCKSSIMLTKDGTEYIKTSAYYYIGHFSKYIKVGARKIAFSSYTNNIEITAFENVDKSIVIVVLNRFWYSVSYNISIYDELIKDSIAPNTIITYVVSKKTELVL